jgi:hypothetical protein
MLGKDAQTRFDSKNYSADQRQVLAETTPGLNLDQFQRYLAGILSRRRRENAQTTVCASCCFDCNTRVVRPPASGPRQPPK